MKISEIDTRIFSIISGDKNKIHLSKQFAKNYFFKEPIAHGVLAVLLCLSGFLRKVRKKVFLKKITITFHNYINLGEEFKIEYKKNLIRLRNNLNKKITISLNYRFIKKFVHKKNKYKSKYKLNGILNLNLIDLLIKSSKIVGNTYPGNGGLIHQINYIADIKYKKKNLSVTKKRNFYKINLAEKSEKIEIISSKTKSFENLKKIVNKKKIYNYDNFKIMVFGPGSILSEKVKEYFSLSKVNFIDYSFRLNNKGFMKEADKIKIKKTIEKQKPNLIFYFSSPKITLENKNNKFLNTIYKEVYFNVLVFLIKILKKNKLNSKIFYPSTTFLSNEGHFEKNSSYVCTKKMAEKFFERDENSRFIKSFRLPKYKSTSNYNLLGYYDGENINNFKFYLDKFLN
tara:strand:+ start:1889 stop:3085 length:1197 start_codon:yes stop_codon:yes gene_type:complete